MNEFGMSNMKEKSEPEARPGESIDNGNDSETMKSTGSQEHSEFYEWNFRLCAPRSVTVATVIHNHRARKM